MLQLYYSLNYCEMTLEYEINKPSDIIYDYLTDMQKFVSVHPVIFKAEEKGENNYLIFEKLKFLFIPVTFTYPAKVIDDKDNKEVKMTAVVQKMVYVDMLFKLEPDGTKTKVTEIVNFRSFMPIGFIMKAIFKKQHALLFKNIEALN